jgi:hypothetical protein
LGVRVKGKFLGFRVRDWGLGLGFRVRGSGIRVKGLGFGI